MTTASRTYARVVVVIDHPVERVWTVVAAFGGLERWAEGVTGCIVEGEDIGAVRTVALGERQARERLEAIDPAARTIRYHILPPHQMPADNVYSEMKLTRLDEARTEIAWQSEASDFRVSPEELGARIEAFYSGSIEGLARLLDG